MPFIKCNILLCGRGVELIRPQKIMSLANNLLDDFVGVCPSHDERVNEVLKRTSGLTIIFSHRVTAFFSVRVANEVRNRSWTHIRCLSKALYSVCRYAGKTSIRTKPLDLADLANTDVTICLTFPICKLLLGKYKKACRGRSNLFELI